MVFRCHLKSNVSKVGKSLFCFSVDRPEEILLEQFQKKMTNGPLFNSPGNFTKIIKFKK